MQSATSRWIILLSALLTAPAPAANKCVNMNGQISYQAMPCPATARGGDMRLNVNRAVAGPASPPVASMPAASSVGPVAPFGQSPNPPNPISPQRPDAAP